MIAWAQMEGKMDAQAELRIVRAAYAKQVLAAASVANAGLAQAFAAIPREDFLGPGPWLVLRWLRNYVPTPDADPIYLYTLSIRPYPPPASTWCMLELAQAITRRSSHISSDRQGG
jgi:protein-L-isoaspartate O-methyltransferase